jgi:hypothetical protein
LTHPILSEKFCPSIVPSKRQLSENFIAIGHDYGSVRELEAAKGSDRIHPKKYDNRIGGL